MISKELLSEILNANITLVDGIYENTLGFSIKEVDIGRINIHELAHKCKEWAYDKGYYIKTEGKMTDGSIFCEINKKYGFHGDTESEVIFKACEWILNAGE